MEYVTDVSVPLNILPAAYRHPLAQQYEEIDEDGDLVRSFDEWGMASVLTYAYSRKIVTESEYKTLEEIIGICLEQSRHTRAENIELFKAIKSRLRYKSEEEALPYCKQLTARIGCALAEQHGVGDDDEEDDNDRAFS